MGKRAAAADETRRRIVDATHALHIEQGIAATSWDDIAARAGVGVGTVYRHFPSLDELIPACAAFSMEIVGLPDRRGGGRRCSRAPRTASTRSSARCSRSTSAARRSCGRC